MFTEREREAKSGSRVGCARLRASGSSSPATRRPNSHQMLSRLEGLLCLINVFDGLINSRGQTAELVSAGSKERKGRSRPTKNVFSPPVCQFLSPSLLFLFFCYEARSHTFHFATLVSCHTRTHTHTAQPKSFFVVGLLTASSVKEKEKLSLNTASIEDFWLLSYIPSICLSEGVCPKL